MVRIAAVPRPAIALLGAVAAGPAGAGEAVTLDALSRDAEYGLCDFSLTTAPMLGGGGPIRTSFFYSRKKPSLVSCASQDGYSSCGEHTPPEKPWPEELKRAEENGWTYKGVLAPNPAYALNAAIPFERWTRHSFYLARSSPVVCTATLTRYDFEYDRDGTRIRYKSTRKEEAEFQCRPMVCGPVN